MTTNPSYKTKTPDQEAWAKEQAKMLTSYADYAFRGSWLFRWRGQVGVVELFTRKTRWLNKSCLVIGMYTEDARHRGHRGQRKQTSRMSLDEGWKGPKSRHQKGQSQVVHASDRRWAALTGLGETLTVDPLQRHVDRVDLKKASSRRVSTRTILLALQS